MPSYKTSTLSLMLIGTTASIFLLILLVLFIAINYPTAYEAISQKEYLVVIIVWAYILVWNNIWSAYLTQRGIKKDTDLNQVPDKKLNEPEDENIDDSTAILDIKSQD